jgi:hypothetical protein
MEACSRARTHGREHSSDEPSHNGSVSSQHEPAVRRAWDILLTIVDVLSSEPAGGAFPMVALAAVPEEIGESV